MQNARQIIVIVPGWQRSFRPTRKVMLPKLPKPGRQEIPKPIVRRQLDTITKRGYIGRS